MSIRVPGIKIVYPPDGTPYMEIDGQRIHDGEAALYDICNDPECPALTQLPPGTVCHEHFVGVQHENTHR